MACGLWVQPRSPIPAAIAPEVNSKTSTPALPSPASSLTNRAIRRLSRWPLSRVSRLVPILTTSRPTLRLISKFDFSDADVVTGRGAVAGQFFFHAHLFKNILEALQAFLLVKIGHR